MSINKFFASSDLSKLTVGVSTNLKEFLKVNGSYIETNNIDVGESVFKVLTDSTQEYTVLLGNFMNIHVYYICSSYCVECYFPQNCSACENSSELVNGICESLDSVEVTNDPVEVIDSTNLPTNVCVQNKFNEKGICEIYCD